MIMKCYQDLLNPLSDSVAEKKTGYHSLTERHIQAVWFEQKYFKNLMTPDGVPIQVISPGIWNGESGPDFLKAHLKIGDQIYRGDIEIHLQDESWVQHRHHEDERYNQVILHLSLWSPCKTKPINTKSGQAIRTAYLESFLTVPIQRLLHLIDLDLYPYKRFVGSGSCAQSLFKTLSEEKIRSLFISAAHWRLQQKKKYLAIRFEKESLQLSAGIAMALGYKNNAEAFMDIFVYLLDHRDLSSDELLAISLGISGFFDQHAKKQWTQSTKFSELKVIWEGKRGETLHQTQLQLDHVRPYNHPVRRLVYLSKLLSDPEMEGIGERMIDCWRIRKNNFTVCREELLQCIPSYEDEYWNHHYLFEDSLKKQNLVLIGEDLKRTILINALLPILQSYVEMKGDPAECDQFQGFYASFRSSTESGKSRYLVHRFFGDTPKGQLLRRSQIEQGAYQLHKDFCVHYEASCEGCPFVDRYLEGRAKD